MRNINPEHQYEYTAAPDTMSTFVTVANTAQSDSYPSGAEYVHFSSDVRMFINLETTSAVIPTTSAAASTAAVDINILHRVGHEHIYRVPSDAASFSIISDSTGVVTAEFWKD